LPVDCATDRHILKLQIHTIPTWRTYRLI
jgi:hypothetical protein